MTENYQQLLLKQEWKDKVDKIKSRDNYLCTKCLSKDNLHVHHTYYQSGILPWEYPDESLITLCKNCHEYVHKTTKIPIKRRKRTFEERLLDYPPYVRESILRHKERNRLLKSNKKK